MLKQSHLSTVELYKLVSSTAKTTESHPLQNVLTANITYNVLVSLAHCSFEQFLSSLTVNSMDGGGYVFQAIKKNVLLSVPLVV